MAVLEKKKTLVRNKASALTAYIQSSMKRTYKIANAVSRLEITVPAQVGLDRLFRSTVFLLTHDGFIAINGILAVLHRRSKQFVEQE
jgi:hypothetical protein